MIKIDRDTQTIELAIDLLVGLNIKYNDFDKDFDDLLKRFENWSNEDTKQIIIRKLLQLKGKSKKELEYWQKIEELAEKELQV